MRYSTTLAAEMLLAKAEGLGADLERSWPIVAFAPPGPSYRLKSPMMGEIILTRNDFGVSVKALQDMTTITATIPCYRNHAQKGNSFPDIGIYRVIPNEPTATNSLVGNICALTWDPDIYGLVGVLEAVPEWDAIFNFELSEGTLRNRAFSVDFVGPPTEWRPNAHDSTTHLVYQDYYRVISWDLVNYPAAGGRFMLPGCEPTYQELDEIDLAFFKYAPRCASWVDDIDIWRQENDTD